LFSFFDMVGGSIYNSFSRIIHIVPRDTWFS
jgi:mannose/fructose-specific phosphotransferase system component IIA